MSGRPRASRPHPARAALFVSFAVTLGVRTWAGCDGAAAPADVPADVQVSADTLPSADAALGPDVAPDASQAAGPWAGMAVVCSDYSSTAISLVDPLGRAVTTPTLIHSGSLPPGVMPALGGDVDLPTTPSPDGAVVLLDRTPGAVLTFVDPATGAVTRQVSVATGFASNPHDALVAGDDDALPGVAPGSVLVTRYDPNPLASTPPVAPDGTSAPLDAGDDLLLVGPDGAPVAALPFTEADGFPGRPDRLVPVASRPAPQEVATVWVSLNRVSRDWQTYRQGAVAVVDISPGDVPSLHLRARLPTPGLRNCGALAVPPPAPSGRAVGSEPTVALSCGGSWQVGTESFDGDESAVVLWTVDPAGAGAERARLPATALPPALAGRTFGPGLALLPSGAVVATVYGGASSGHGGQATGDAAVLWDPATGEVTTLMQTDSPWTLWAAQAAPDGAVLLPVADDLAPRLCRVRPGASMPAPSCLDACASTGLPPRAVRPFLPSR